MESASGTAARRPNSNADVQSPADDRRPLFGRLERHSHRALAGLPPEFFRPPKTITGPGRLGPTGSSKVSPGRSVAAGGGVEDRSRRVQGFDPGLSQRFPGREPVLPCFLAR